MQYTPDVLSPRLSLTCCKVLIAFFTGMCTIFVLCIATSVFISVDVGCWYGNKATPVGSLVVFCGSYELFLS
jgi:hypothetical protein